MPTTIISQGWMRYHRERWRAGCHTSSRILVDCLCTAKDRGGPELSWTAGGGGSELYELDDGGGGPCRLGDETKECELDGRGAR